jgi:hypothetical protein
MSICTSWIKHFADTKHLRNLVCLFHYALQQGVFHCLLPILQLCGRRSLIHSAKRCCLHECLNKSVFCSRIFLLCTPLKYHIPNMATDTSIWHAVSQPKQTDSLCDCRVRFDCEYWNGLSTNFLCIIICQYIGSFMSVLHLVQIMPSYSRKTINRMRTKINTVAL